MNLSSYKLSRRAVLWSGLILVVAYILYLNEARYNNIDPSGLDYHLVEVQQNCKLGDICQLKTPIHGIELEYLPVIVKASGSEYLRFRLMASEIYTRVVLRVVRTAEAKAIKAGVVSNVVKGQDLEKEPDNRWQSKAINFEPGQKNIRILIYLFTAGAIYEIRQTLVHANF